jgi:predicted DNA-binding transcriptional regulator AlpA
MKFIRVPEVAEKLGQSVPKTWNDVATNPAFPQPVKRGGLTCWVEGEVDTYIAQQVAEFRSKAQSKRASTFKAAKASVERRATGRALSLYANSSTSAAGSEGCGNER